MAPELALVESDRPSTGVIVLLELDWFCDVVSPMTPTDDELVTADVISTTNSHVRQQQQQQQKLKYTHFYNSTRS